MQLYISWIMVFVLPLLLAAVVNGAEQKPIYIDKTSGTCEDGVTSTIQSAAACEVAMKPGGSWDAGLGCHSQNTGCRVLTAYVSHVPTGCIENQLPDFYTQDKREVYFNKGGWGAEKTGLSKYSSVLTYYDCTPMDRCTVPLRSSM